MWSPKYKINKLNLKQKQITILLIEVECGVLNIKLTNLISSKKANSNLANRSGVWSPKFDLNILRIKKGNVKN